MLKELIQYLTTPCPTYVRRMGYLQEAIATQARYHRCRKSWQTHLDQTKSYILNAADRCEEKRTVLILGARNCYDIPLAELSDVFERVILVDIVFLPAAKRLAKRYGAECYACDVTGIAEEVLSMSPRRRPHTCCGGVFAGLTQDSTISPQDQPSVFALWASPDKVGLLRGDNHGDVTIDLVISANMLSQLPLIPKRWLESKGYQDEEVSRFCHQIIQSHLDLLKQFDCPVCLITDTAYLKLDQEGKCVEEQDALWGVELPKTDKTWLWDIAPAPELDPEISVQHRVVATIL